MESIEFLFNAHAPLLVYPIKLRQEFIFDLLKMEHWAYTSLQWCLKWVFL